MTGFPVRLFKNGLGLTGTVCRNTPHQLGVFSKKISSQNIGVGGLTADIVPSWILLLYDIHDTWCYTASEVHGVPAVRHMFVTCQHSASFVHAVACASSFWG